MARKYDIVVFGATGYTGAYVVEYLAESAPATLKWAIAGRSFSKVQDARAQVLARLAKRYPDRASQEGAAAFSGVANVDVLVADSKDQESVDKVVGQTRVVIACAGPFQLVGTPVISACARLGTDYVDITGESKWILQMTGEWDKVAKEKGAVIVPSCGFDSVPSDLFTHLLALHLLSYSLLTASVRVSCTDFAAGASGGTITSAAHEFANAGKVAKDAFKMEKGPKPPKGAGKLPSTSLFPLFWDGVLKMWQGSWVMSRVNANCIRRSQWLQGWRYGNFLYTETRGYPSLFSAAYANVLFFTMGLLLAFAPTRNFLLKYVLPKQGEGTVSEEDRRRNYFKYEGWAVSEVGEDGKQKKAKGVWEGKGDPGYWQTCIMVSQSALALVYDRDSLPGVKELHGGVLTPASAFGTVLVDRLKATGTVKIEVGDA
ncbi:hypothetical protein M427DRAFT_144102 [Gonapodya prolifera JEL478]|uniref:Saccharopine dehydrogenase NADP binding domain-containing protein n=1 Tax=Gonapodya prolifera (strain JEL478) TaxID=1344416 RepID=A0A139ANF6_GONPJ|nr:hypothetical protein M427DRAFT_144102 [Gonapodya prolifera JEL478]|eukprot:KXS18035.1 hypothetical protein M427DRAFT_144102 [Gonapodya prolifera JEL478]